MGKWLTPDTLPAEMICWRVYCPEGWGSFLYGALSLLANEYNWQEHGSVTPSQAASLWLDANYDTMEGVGCDQGGIMQIGMIMWWPSYTTPDGWFLCNGDYISPTEYPDLYAVLGFTFGGPDGEGKFALPNLYGRFPLGVWPEVYDPGDTGGNENIILTAAQLPAHSHGVPAKIIGNRGFNAGTHAVYVAPTSSETIQTDDTGDGDDINIMPPYMALVPLIYAG